ncbi:MAG TPA: restriction endonuclease subunit S, partial [Bacteroidia bacterium]|nr:restriction endonuclease subunit S [Bacteroidia bacterium]
MSEEKNIPKHWQVKKLGEVCTYSKGKMPQVLVEEKNNECAIPYINIKAFEKGIFAEYTNGVKCNLCEENDLLMVWDGARCGLIGKAKKGAVGSTLMKILPKENIHKEYLYHFISSKFWTLNTKPRGVGIPHIEPTLLWNFELAVPPLPEQQAIVSKIEELLSELENGKQQLQTAQQQLKVYRQSLLKWAFEGKLTNKNVNGELPKHWEVKKLGEICVTTSGGTPSRGNKKYYEGNIPWVKSGELDKGLILDTEETISEEAIKNSSAKIFPKGTLLIALYGATIGKLAFLGVNAATNQAICGIFKSEKINSNYLFHFLFYKKPSLVKQSIGGAQPNISQGILKNLEIPLPPLKEQQRIVAELESKLTVCDKIEETISQSLQQAETLKQSILKKAFEGKLV